MRVRANYPDTRRLHLGAERLEDRLLLDVRLVADINEIPLARSSFPDDFVQLDELVLFTAETLDGRELWRTDGTAAGTQQIVDLEPGPAMAGVSDLMLVDEYVYFQLMTDDNIGRPSNELWRTDGTTEGTIQVSDDVDPDNLVELAGDFYTARQFGSVLIRISSDGETSGIPPRAGLAFDDLTDLTAFGDFLFFAADTRQQIGADNVSFGTELWVSDLTRDGTRMLKDISSGNSSNPSHLFATDEALFFFAITDATPRLWKTDGSTNGTQPVASLPITTASHGQIPVSDITAVNGILYFVIEDTEHGWELWRSDGTENGTFLVKDIREAAEGASPTELFVFNDTLFFNADDGITGSELWTSDGTAAGTVLIKDIIEGPIGSGPGDFAILGGQLYFSAGDQAHGLELWKSDGTAAGTTLAFDLIDGPASSIPTNIRAVGDHLYFAAQGIPVEGFEPWRSDGTLAGTSSLGNLAVDETDGSLPRAVTRVGETIYFAANDGVNGHELWKTDGTTTTLVKDITPGPGSSDIGGMWNVDDTLYLAASDGVHGIELWASDGTAEGTRLVEDIEPGFGGSAPGNLIKVGDVIYFSAYDSDHGEEIWKTDGTAEGTQLVKNINPGFAGSHPTDLTDVDGTLFFAADFEGKQEIWRSDGTAEGTVLASHVVLDPYSGMSPLVGMNEELFFVGGRLFKTAGTPESTAQLALAFGIVDYGDTLLLLDAFDGQHSHVIEFDPRRDEFPSWREWVEIPRIVDNDPQLTLVGGRLFFNASTTRAPGNRDIELWSYDPRDHEIHLVTGANVNAIRSPEPKELSIHNDLIYFVANGDRIGTELWSTNGTALNTFPIADIAAGPLDSLPSQLTFLDDTLFVRANDRVSGTELWAIDLPPVVRIRDSSIDVVEGSGDDVHITLTRLGDTSSPLNVRIETIGGSATGSSAGPDHDFVDMPITATFAANETEVAVVLPIVDDQLREVDETIELAITNVNGGRIGAHFELIVTLVDDDHLRGDLDFDRDLDLADIDALVSAIVNDPPPDEFFFYDLNKDGVLNPNDIDDWLILAGTANLPAQQPYAHGDANLDGMVDASDYGIVNDHLFGTAPAWSMGDFNADGVTDVSDFNIWNENKFTQPANAAAPNSRPPRAPLTQRFAIALDSLDTHFSTGEQRDTTDNDTSVHASLLTVATTQKPLVPRSPRGRDGWQINRRMVVDDLITDQTDVKRAALIDTLFSFSKAFQQTL